MIDGNLEDLIQRHVDGDLDPAEVEELQRGIAKDRGAELFQTRLDRLVSRLAEEGLEDPPADLRLEIIRALARVDGHDGASALSAPKRSPQRSRRHSSGSGIRISRRDVYAFFCGGVLVAALVAAMIVSGRAPRLDADALRGTMAGAAAPHDWTLREHQPIDGSGFTGMAQVSSAGPWVEVRLNLSADRQIDVVLEFDGTTLVPMGFERSEPGPGLDVGPTHVRFEHDGVGSYRVVLRSIPEMEETIPLDLQQVTSESTLRVILNTPSGDD